MSVNQLITSLLRQRVVQNINNITMKKNQSPKVRLAISLLKLCEIALLIAFVVLLTKGLNVHPAITVLLLFVAVSVIRILYRFVCMIAAIAILIMIICSLCLICFCCGI